MGAERCRERPLNADDVEALVWRIVTDALRQPELLIEGVVKNVATASL